MLTIIVPGEDYFDDSTQKFVTQGDVTLELEHSLASLSKWESRWEKPFLSKDDKTPEEILSYIEMMIVTPDYPPEIFTRLKDEHFNLVNDYINSKQTATWFSEVPGEQTSREIITAELIYYWMVTMRIPFECQYWHINRLLTLIRVINVKNAPAKKMSPAEIAARNRALNEQRRKELGTRG